MRMVLRMQLRKSRPHWSLRQNSLAIANAMAWCTQMLPGQSLRSEKYTWFLHATKHIPSHALVLCGILFDHGSSSNLRRHASHLLCAVVRWQEFSIRSVIAFQVDVSSDAELVVDDLRCQPCWHVHSLDTFRPNVMLSLVILGSNCSRESWCGWAFAHFAGCLQSSRRLPF